MWKYNVGSQNPPGEKMLGNGEGIAGLYGSFQEIEFTISSLL